MTQQETDTYLKQILALRDRLKGDVSALEGEGFRKSGGEASGNLSNVPVHMADLSTDNYEEEITLGLLQNQEQILEEVAGAMRRLEEGTFGQCQECGKAISKPRLEALPYTPYCVNCARQIQEEQG